MKKFFLMCGALSLFAVVVLADEQKKESAPPPQKQEEQVIEKPVAPAPNLTKVEIRKLPQVVPQSSQEPVQSK